MMNRQIKDLKIVIHEAHEDARCIGEREWHNYLFAETISSFKNGLPFISGFYSNLLVAASKINFGEDNGAMKLVQQIIKLGNGKVVFDNDFVDCFVIHTHAP